MDDIIVFHQLEREEIFSIVDLMIAKVDGRLKDRDMAIELRPAAKDLLSQRGYDPVLGARPLRRTIQREIEDSLSEKILFGELRPGQIVIVDTEGSGETAKFTFSGVPKPDVVDDVPAPETGERAGRQQGQRGGQLNEQPRPPGRRRHRLRGRLTRLTPVRPERTETRDPRPPIAMDPGFSVRAPAPPRRPAQLVSLSAVSVS